MGEPVLLAAGCAHCQQSPQQQQRVRPSVQFVAQSLQATDIE
jgi:hypothetical protein